MKKKRVAGGLTGIAALIAGFFCVTKYQDWQQVKISNLQNMIAELEEEYVPLRFEMTGSDENKSVNVRFIDLNGSVAADQVIDLDGTEAHFDFKVIELSSANNSDSQQFMFFPYKFYSEKTAPENGISLYKFYNKSGFPAIYRGFENHLSSQNILNKNEYTEKLHETFKYILNEETDKLSGFFGNAVHDANNIFEFKKGYTYSLVCHPHTGAIEVRRE